MNSLSVGEILDGMGDAHLIWSVHALLFSL